MSLTPRSVENIKTNAQAALEILLDTLDEATEEISDGAAEIRRLKDEVAALEAEIIALRKDLAKASWDRERAAGNLPPAPTSTTAGAPFDQRVAP